MALSDDSEVPLKKCCIHIVDSEDNTDNLKLFSEITLKKCRDVLRARKVLNLKYSHFELPEICNDIYGYHTLCYRKFTAVKTKQLEQGTSLSLVCENVEQSVEFSSNVPSCSSSNLIGTRSSSVQTLRNPRRGTLENLCIFCNKSSLRYNHKKIPLSSCETKNFENNIKKYASYMNDSNLLTKIASIDFIAKEVKYHRICRVKYEQKYRQKQKSEEKCKPSLFRFQRKIHQESFGMLCAYIEMFVIQQKLALYVSRILSMYEQYCFENCSQYMEEKNSSDISFTAHNIRSKLQNHFKGAIKFDIHKKKSFIYNALMSSDESKALLESENNLNNELDVQNTAFLLRREVLNIIKKPLPDNLQIENIYAGECEIPPLLKLFFSSLLSGPHSRRNKDSEVIKGDSLCQDVIYNVSNARIKTSKHLELGIVIKSLTNSRKIIEILNRLGHCANYSLLEELETELTYSCVESSTLIPSTLQKLPELFTGLAFDNFDRFVETLSGKNTLHDTVEIVYQFDKAGKQTVTLPCEPLCEIQLSIPSTSRKRRRAFQIDDQEIEPYYKKPRLVKTFEISIDDINRKASFPEELLMVDYIWILSVALLQEQLPMWVGWNSERTKDEFPKQNIWYLPPINQSPTNHSVVLHTLKMAQKVADECNQKYICVTYDLAIAKMALQIQSAEHPRFNRVFILLGAFHIQMAFFKAVGKYIAESGAPHILCEVDILAPGSLRGFITGTHFNRCKRIHEILAAALQTLHIEEYVKTQTSEHMSEITRDLKKMHDLKTKDMSEAKYLEDFLQRYRIYYKETLDGKHGHTAQFWLVYIELIHLYKMFSRSIRTNNFELYMICLPQIATLMFAFNHQNYSRWILRFYNDLSNVSETHPGLQDHLIQGGFSIRRTDKPFSRSPIDLALEQTINRDAGNKMTGITSMTNSISARKRWGLSHSLRTSIISHLFEKLNLSGREITDELRPHVIKNNWNAYNNVLNGIKSFLNPFEESTNIDSLFNISTGKSASTETKNFLLNAMKIGEKARNSFITECNDEENRFEQPIKKVNVKTFATDSKPLVCKYENNKIKEIKFERDLFGRILVLAVQYDIDLETILKFPLTPIPLSLSHMDGSMNKTNKSNLLKLLEEKGITDSSPNDITCTIIDGFYFMYLLGADVPQTFGRISRHILVKLCKSKGSRVDLIFDKFSHPWIKDIERERRGAENTVYIISGPNQKRPQNFYKALRNPSFKTSLINFLIQDWTSDEYIQIIGTKTIYVTCGDDCYKFTAGDGNIEKSLHNELRCQHEEADTRIAFHLINIVEDSKVIIKASDTDILIILLGNMDILTTKRVQIWMECGTLSKNNLRLVDINKIASILGPSLCNALPAFHAFTGCDYTASFARKAKLTPFKLLEKSKKFQEAFSRMGESETLSSETIEGVEEYVCEMYGKRKLSSVNKARFEIFLDCYKPKPNQSPFGGIKNFEASRIPPCKDTLICKIRRTNQIAAIWKSACSEKPKFFNPERNGWIIEDGEYKIKWFESEQFPQKLNEVLVAADDSSEVDNITEPEDAYSSDDDE